MLFSTYTFIRTYTLISQVKVCTYLVSEIYDWLYRFILQENQLSHWWVLFQDIFCQIASMQFHLLRVIKIMLWNLEYIYRVHNMQYIHKCFFNIAKNCFPGAKFCETCITEKHKLLGWWQKHLSRWNICIEIFVKSPHNEKYPFQNFEKEKENM